MQNSFRDEEGDFFAHKVGQECMWGGADTKNSMWLRFGDDVGSSSLLTFVVGWSCGGGGGGGGEWLSVVRLWRWWWWWWWWWWCRGLGS